ncbi:SDR family NAD(P)-dependent oxidoreductase [Gordonia sp. TBRC 11910]|uniref:SDR family NAD(P)-dependent oxidoreductase n=1 Tax=Gordonia asplenii TaxID=2725283 RepID=A0A848L266_9ACTN|nr:oxidoreductase [Gordonia asplenii]NMO04522.1 SDR family NAD(P)-dependent oxidoreductase [Gordonia asplenii]
MSDLNWALSDAPSQSGRVAVVTGANSGIGRETARGLAQLGARVIMACRNVESAREAREDILGGLPDAIVDIVALDVSSLESVRSAAAEIIGLTEAVDLVIANAGLIASEYALTVDGFEMDFGTNFLGHFALVGRLLDHVAPGGRIVTVGSVAHRRGTIDFDDIDMRRSFSVSAAYSRSKLAQMVFATELDRRLSASNREVTSVMAHPGASRTGVMRGHNRLLQWGFHSPKTRRLVHLFIQEPPEGALPTLRAATDPSARGGHFYGPSGRLQFTGAPVLVQAADAVYDPDLGEGLWVLAEKLTGVDYL